MNACDREKLVLLAAGELEPARAADVERHVAECPRCARELAGLREGLEHLQSLPPMDLPAEVAEGVGEPARRALLRRRTIRPSFFRRYRHTLATAAALALLAGWALVAHLFAPPEARMARLWDRTDWEVVDGTSAAEDLAALHDADPWTRAEKGLVVELSEGDDVEVQLLDLDEGLELVERFAGDS